MIRALVISLEGGAELRIGTESGAVLLEIRGGVAELDAPAARIVGRSLLELAAELELAARIGELAAGDLELEPDTAETPAARSPRAERLDRYLERRKAAPR